MAKAGKIVPAKIEEFHRLLSMLAADGQSLPQRRIGEPAHL